MKDIVGTFRLDADLKLISNQLNKDSKFIKTVHNKASEAAKKPDRQFCKETYDEESTEAWADDNAQKIFAEKYFGLD